MCNSSTNIASKPTSNFLATLSLVHFVNISSAHAQYILIQIKAHLYNSTLGVCFHIKNYTYLHYVIMLQTFDGKIP